MVHKSGHTFEILAVLALAMVILVACSGPITLSNPPAPNIPPETYTKAADQFRFKVTYGGETYFGDTILMTDGQKIKLLPSVVEFNCIIICPRHVVENKTFEIDYIGAVYQVTSNEQANLLNRRVERNPDSFTCHANLHEGEHYYTDRISGLEYTGRIPGVWFSDSCEWQIYTFEAGITERILHLSSVANDRGEAYADMWVPSSEVEKVDGINPE